MVLNAQLRTQFLVMVICKLIKEITQYKIFVRLTCKRNNCKFHKSNTLLSLEESNTVVGLASTLKKSYMLLNLFSF